MDVSIVGNHTHTHTCLQIRKHKTNHLLIGRKVLAAADETKRKQKGKGEKEKTLLIKLLFIRQYTLSRQC